MNTLVQRDVTLRRYQSRDREAVVALWRECDLTRPWNDPLRDIERKLRQQPEMFLVAERESSIVGTIMAGYDGHRGWINYLAVAPSCRRQGIATRLIRQVERLLEETGCPKVNLQIRSSNHAVISFYETLGYLSEAVTGMGKRLIHDTPRDE